MKHLLLIIIIFLVGCQKFYVLDVTKKKEKLIFSNTDVTSKCTDGIAIYDFEVIHINNDGSQTAWSLVKESRLSTEIGIYQFPITYGDNYQGTKVIKKAIKLAFGVYKLGATLSCSTSTDTFSLSMLGSFAINEEGKVVTDEEEIKLKEKHITR